MTQARLEFVMPLCHRVLLRSCMLLRLSVTVSLVCYCVPAFLHATMSLCATGSLCANMSLSNCVLLSLKNFVNNNP